MSGENFTEFENQYKRMEQDFSQHEAIGKIRGEFLKVEEIVVHDILTIQRSTENQSHTDNQLGGNITQRKIKLLITIFHPSLENEILCKLDLDRRLTQSQLNHFTQSSLSICVEYSLLFGLGTSIERNSSLMMYSPVFSFEWSTHWLLPLLTPRS